MPQSDARIGVGGLDGARGRRLRFWGQRVTPEPPKPGFPGGRDELSRTKSGATPATLSRSHVRKCDVLLTIDKDMPYQQSLKGLQIFVAVLDIVEPSVEVFSQYVRSFAALIESLSPGSFNLIVPES